MRPTPNLIADQHRQNHPVLGWSEPGQNYGYFYVDGLRVIAHDGAGPASGWEHVSVSLPTRCPTWREMCRVKDLFWEPTETVVQFHPKKAEYVNRHPYTLHLWKQVGVEAVLPPKELIG